MTTFFEAAKYFAREKAKWEDAARVWMREAGDLADKGSDLRRDIDELKAALSDMEAENKRLTAEFYDTKSTLATALRRWDFEINSLPGMAEELSRRYTRAIKGEATTVNFDGGVPTVQLSEEALEDAGCPTPHDILSAALKPTGPQPGDRVMVVKDFGEDAEYGHVGEVTSVKLDTFYPYGVDGAKIRFTGDEIRRIYTASSPLPSADVKVLRDMADPYPETALLRRVSPDSWKWNGDDAAAPGDSWDSARKLALGILIEYHDGDPID